MIEYTGADHFTVSVEFEKADTHGMHHSAKEVQILDFQNDIQYETFNITIANQHGGDFKIRFVNPRYDESVSGSIRSW